MSLTSVILPRNWWLMGVAIAFAVVLLVVRPPAAAERSVAPLFPGFDAAQVTRIQIESPMDGGEASELTTMVRAGTGEPWSIVELHGAPGNAIRLDQVLSWVGTMTDLDVVSTGATSARDYGLGEGQAIQVTLGVGDGTAESGPTPAGGELSFFASPAEGGGAFVRLAGQNIIARVPRFPLRGRGHLSWFERDSLVPLESIQIRKVVATGTALESPVTVTLPERVMTEFVDGSGVRVEPARALELFRSLRATFPDDVIAALEPSSPAALHLDITPAVGTSFQVTFTDIGQTAASGNEEPGKAFQSGRGYGVLVNPQAIDNVLNALRAIASPEK